MKVIKSLLVTLLFLVMGTLVMVLDAPVVIDVVAAAYLAAVSAFLGVDIQAMIKSSSVKPQGEYEPLNSYKYVISFVQMALLTAVSVYRYQVHGVAIAAAIGLFGAGCIVVIGLVLGGLEGNKHASIKEGTCVED